MKQIIDFLRKIGLLRISSGDYQTGGFDDRKDIKKSNYKKSEGGVALLATSVVASAFWLRIFWVLVSIIILFFIFIFRNYGLSFFGLVFAVIWFWFFKNFKLQLASGKLLVWKMSLIFGVLFILSLIILIPSSSDSKSPKSVNKAKVSQTEDAGFLEVNQAQFSSFIFGSDSSGGNKPDTVNITINPILTFSVDSSQDVKLESFEIKNLAFTKKPAVGKIKIIHPKHRSTDESCTGFYFGGCDDKSTPDQIKSDGSNIEYEIVEAEDPSQVSPKYYDQIFGDWFIRPEFRVVIHGIGSFDYDKIMKRDKVVSGVKYADYAGIEAGDLASVLEFDVIAKMSNGEKFKKHFKAEFNGNDLLKAQTVQVEY